MVQSSPRDGMDQLSTRLTGRQWEFALEVYCQQGVGAACLNLQDRRNVDVTVLLMVAYGWSVLKRDFSPSEIADLDAHVRNWRENVVKPLRQVRRHLKGHVTDHNLETVKRFRDKVKALELEGEQIELACLAEHLAISGRAGPDERRSLDRTLGDVVAYYSPGMTPDQADQEAIGSISRAVADFAAAHLSTD